MASLLEETLACAEKTCHDNGFDAEQTQKMLDAGKRDLVASLKRLDELLNEPRPSIEKISQTLHALRGLAHFMGNHALSKKCQAIQEEPEPSRILQQLNNMLMK